MKTKDRKKKKKLAEDWDADDDDIEGYREWDLQQKLNSDRYNSRLIKRFHNAENFDLRFFQKYGFSVPLYFQTKSGLGITMPPEGFSVDDVKRNVGTRRFVDVVDVRTQKALTMSMGDWAKYYNNPKKERLLNVISLEFSHTKLSTLIEAPTVVKQLDWVERVWPSYLKDLQKEATNDLSVMKYPKVRKYALMSVRGCYTDFHVDFGGTSVWYHIFRGAKVFWMVPPTEENLRIFEDWSVSGKQGEVFFPDLVSDCECIHLAEGTTFFIPPGWIHGVYTPEDSLVFGGNYLHTYGSQIQLRVWDLEDAMHVKMKYRYPFFKQLHWYVIAGYVRALLDKKYVVDELEADNERTESLVGDTGPWIHLTKYEVENLQAIVNWLRRLPADQRGIPDDVRDAGDLVRDTQILVNLHNDDDFFGGAINGVTVLEKKKKKKPLQRPAPVRKVEKQKGGMRRRIRCQRCEACCRDYCRQCTFCRDMVKFGGQGLLRKSCVEKVCISPQLPSTTACDLCGLTFAGIFECGLCWSVVHPQCLYMRSCREGVDLRQVKGVSCPELPNFWHCPLCVWEGRRAKPRPLRPAPTVKTLEREAEAKGMRHTSKRAASGDAFARLVAMTCPVASAKRQREDEVISPLTDSSSAQTVVLPSPERPEPKSEISTVSCLDDYVDHEEVIGGSDYSASPSRQNEKLFVVPKAEEVDESFEERFVARTSSRGEVERPKRFIEEG